MADSTGTGTPKEHKVDLFRGFQKTKKKQQKNGAQGILAGTETLRGCKEFKIRLRGALVQDPSLWFWPV